VLFTPKHVSNTLTDFLFSLNTEHLSVLFIDNPVLVSSAALLSVIAVLALAPKALCLLEEKMLLEIEERGIIPAAQSHGTKYALKDAKKKLFFL